MTGVVFPKSKVTISVCFSPEFAIDNAVEAFCNVTCSAVRLHLQLYGKGLGPEAGISPPSWRLNDVSVNEPQKQTIHIFNQGQIPFDFQIKQNNTAFGRLFEFSQREGHLDTVAPNNDVKIDVSFKSSKVGDFAERFEIQLGKKVNPLIFTCEGKVIAPPMKFEETELDFKKVPFKFEEWKEATLVNLSNVEIYFEIEIPEENEKKTFTPENCPKSIKEHGKVKIRIKFNPPREDEFKASLTVKVPNVAQDFATLPLRGVCQRPVVDIKPSESLDFEQVFLRHPKTKEIVLTNNSDLKAKFNVEPQEENSKRIAEYTVTPSKGEIEPHSKRELSVKLEAQMRNGITVPLYIDVSSKVTHERILIKADVLGPQVTVDPLMKEFKEVVVLTEAKEKITVHNNSEIPAKYTAFTRNKNSIFHVEQRAGDLQPDEKKELTIICCPDDADTFEDILYVDICEGLHSEVKLKAKAVGTSISVPQYQSEFTEVQGKRITMYKVPFGTQYINCDAIKTINIENLGRKKQLLKFDRYPPLKVLKQKKEKEKKDTTVSQVTEVKKQNEAEDEENKTIFSIDPPEDEKGSKAVMLEPQHGFTLNCRARSKNVLKDASEQFKFTSSFEGNRKDEDIFIIKFVGNFVVPVLSFSETKLYFKYIWQGDLKRDPIVKDLEIACNCEDPTKGASFRLNVPIPFRTKMPIDKLSMMPGTKQNIQIEFDPSGIEGRESRPVKNNIEIVFDKDKGGGGAPKLIALEADLCYPNLEVTPQMLDFGCILFDTSKKRHMTLKNISELAVKYCWEFVEEISDVIQEVPEEETKKKSKKQNAKALPRVNELYDILPISGLLQPGEVETVEVTYHGIVKTPPSALARCVVEGGPDYPVTFKGEADIISGDVSEKKLVFKDVAYNEDGVETFKIENNGKVQFKYFISLERVNRGNMFRIEPQSGIAQAGEKIKIEVKLKPGIPDKINETLLVYIAHMAPKEIECVGIGTFPFLLFATTRFEKDIFNKKVEEFEKSGKEYSPCLLPKEDIQKLLSKKIEGAGRSQISTMLKPLVAPSEIEVDRQELCKTLLMVILIH